MRILLLSDAFLPHAGGSREYYNNVYRDLASLGDSQVTILTTKVPGWKEFDKAAYSEYFRIYRRSKPLSSWKYSELPKGIFPFFHALWHVLRHAPSVVHAGDLYPPGMVAMVFKMLFGLPYVIYCHGEEITQTDKFRYQPRVRDRIYKNADAVIANSEFARENLLRIGVLPERICKITPGVDADRFCAKPPRRDLQQRYGVEGKLVVLTVARLVPRKGHRVAIRAFAKICDTIPNAHYLIVGIGPEESKLRQLVEELGIANRVTFGGFASGGELPAIYNLCDVMVMPNREEANGDVEGFGIVFMEANAAGKPVVGGRSGGAVEAIVDGATGYLVNPDDPDELASILRRVLSDAELREKLGIAGAARARKDFDWKSRAVTLRNVNQQVLRISGRTVTLPV